MNYISSTTVILEFKRGVGCGWETPAQVNAGSLEQRQRNDPGGVDQTLKGVKSFKCRCNLVL